MRNIIDLKNLVSELEETMISRNYWVKDSENNPTETGRDYADQMASRKEDEIEGIKNQMQEILSKIS